MIRAFAMVRAIARSEEFSHRETDFVRFSRRVWTCDDSKSSCEIILSYREDYSRSGFVAVARRDASEPRIDFLAAIELDFVDDIRLRLSELS